MTEDSNKPVLRIFYFETFDANIFDIVEDALNRSNFNVEQFGGGSWFTKNNTIRGYTDFYIDNYEDFDLEFCREVISSILQFEFDLQVYEDDPFLNISA